MKTINIQEAKTHLSSYVRQVKAGEHFLLCERNVPVAEIHPISKARKFNPAGMGNARGLVVFMSKRFNDPLKDKELAAFLNNPL
ncbi:MAG: type II toxin-antitoxin system Phd/YefM family antitoxin [Verrucomicrobia bacterium]|nr:type II toxin-antitoxin system Phd/YefM family antitoxin [Verrucomicrobiota bacterium]